MPNVIFQNIRELSHQFFIITVSEDAKVLRFQATQPGTSDFYEFSLTQEQLRAIIAPELLAPERKKEMTEWLLDRLFLTREDGEWKLRLHGCTEVPSEPVVLPERVSLHRLSFAERTRLKEHNELMTAKRERALEERTRILHQKEIEERDRQRKLREASDLQRAARIEADKKQRHDFMMRARSERLLKEQHYRENDQQRDSHIAARNQARIERAKAEAAQLQEEKRKREADLAAKKEAERAAKARLEIEVAAKKSQEKQQADSLNARRAANIEQLRKQNEEKARQYAAAQRAIALEGKTAKERKLLEKRALLRQQIEAEGRAFRERLAEAARQEHLEEMRETHEQEREQARRFHVQAHAQALREAEQKKRDDLRGRIGAEKEKNFRLARDARLARLEREGAQHRIDDQRLEKIQERIARRTQREKQYGESLRQATLQEQQEKERKRREAEAEVQRVAAARAAAFQEAQRRKAEADAMEERRNRADLEREYKRQQSELAHLSQLRNQQANKKMTVMSARADRLVSLQKIKADEHAKQEAQRKRWEELEAKRAIAIAAREQARVARFIPSHLAAAAAPAVPTEPTVAASPKASA